MTGFLAEKTPPEGIVYVNMSRGDHTIELLYEIDWHLEVFYNREDIKVEYLDNLSQAQKGSLLVSGDIPRIMDEDVLGKALGKPNHLSTTASKPVITTPPQIIIQSAKKLFRLILNGERVTSEGIYTFYKVRNYWNIYRFEKR